MPAVAQSDNDSNTDSPDEADSGSQESSETESSNGSDRSSDITAQEILTILEIDDRAQVEKVKNWIESPSSQDNPELRERAQNWISNIEEQQEEKAQQLDGYKRISSAVEVVGYEFHPDEETITLLIQSEDSRIVTLQDMGATIASDSGFSYRTESVEAGVTEIQMEAQEEDVNGDKTQMVAVVDNEAQQGNTIARRTESSSFFSTVKWWYIPLAGFGGASLIFVQSIRYIRNKEQEGENEFIPLE
ncbi:hypothetical protein PNQ29_00620 [Halobacterium salinarum]|uniref:hypothetical protein n=1 Tax=Halobacterium salinarum TaxID=2242 RepID=UPI0025521443|nr:hypothetical protein [Halobacterium salinarum]MDL0118263.1 hypothetical protein [Halobacterium salinarum]